MAEGRQPAGKLDWRYTIGAGDWLDKPYLIGSMVVAAAQQAPGSPAGGGVIVALDARSGAPIWRAPLPGAGGWRLTYAPGGAYHAVMV